MTTFDTILKQMMRWWVVIGYLSFTVVSFFYFDKPIAYYFYGLDVKNSLPVIYWLTKLGIGAIDITALLLLALFFRYIYKNKQFETRSWFLWLCALVPNLICLVLKMTLGRARPELLFDDHQFGFYGFHTSSQFWSMPSGHTTTVMGIVFGLCVLFPRYCIAFILFGLGIASTRVFLTDHYLSDVLATTYLTLLEIGGLLYFSRQKLNLIK